MLTNKYGWGSHPADAEHCRVLHAKCPLLAIRLNGAYKNRCSNGTCPVQSPELATCDEIRRLPLVAKRYVKTCRAIYRP